MSQVACIGAGTIGRAWAIRFAMAGHRVSVYDDSGEALGQCMVAIDGSLADLSDAGLIRNAADVRTRIATVRDLNAALESASWVQENVTEDLGVKQDVFAELDRLAPADAVLASSTSEIVGSELFADIKGRPRCLVAHPLNPPFLIPLVELCASPWTSDKTLARAKAFMIECGQKPITVNAEISGFVANRLQLAVLGEALHLVGEGYCSSEDIDTAMKDGLALRWAVVGPFETGHLNASQGYRSYLDIYGHTHKKIIADLNVAYEWGEELIDRIDRDLAARTPPGEVAARQAWRDRQLMKLSKHLSTSR